MPSQWDVLEGAQLGVNVLEVRQCSGAAVPVSEEHSTSDQCLLVKCGKMAPRSWNSGHSQCLGCFRTVLQMLFFLFKSSAWYSRRPTSLRRIVCGAVQLARVCLSDTEGSLVVWRAPALKSIVAFNKRSQGRASFL